MSGLKNNTHLYVAYKKLSSDVRTHRLKVKGQKKIFSANGTQMKAGVSVLISDNIDFKIKTVIRHQEGAIQQEDITFINIYASNIEAPKYITQMLTELRRKMQ